jgi:signal transduction histidine kinase
MWDLYKSYIVGVISLMVIESILIIALATNLQKRKRAEIALRNSRQDLRTLAGRLISSQEEELSRLSREFHDDLAQRLAAVAIESGTLELRSQNIEQSVVGKIRHIKEQLIGLSEDVHAISRQIHPAILRDLGLVSAIKSQCVRFSKVEKMQVDFDWHDVPDAVPNEIALCIYRVIQESLRNVTKHSQAKHVQIDLRGLGGNIILRIKDDGAGFNLQGVRQTPGIGLASMRERVDYVNGRFSISSEPGKGTVVEVSVPGQRRD